MDKANKYIRRIKIVLEGLSQVYEKFKENFEKAVSVAKEYDKEGIIDEKEFAEINLNDDYEH